jgi:hypothetical protein
MDIWCAFIFPDSGTYVVRLSDLASRPNRWDPLTLNYSNREWPG